MSNDIDVATKKSLALAPALVEACQEDPEVLVALTRAQLAVVQDRMVKGLLSDPNASIAQYSTVHERLSKNARLESKEAQGGAAGGGFSVVINLAPPASVTRVIDVTPGSGGST